MAEPADRAEGDEAEIRSPLRRLLPELVALLALLVLLLLVSPDASLWVRDPDVGNQLAKGQQILVGLHPYVDVDSSVYGPAIFYLSAAAQAVAGERVIGELIVVVLGYLLAYALLLRSFRSWSDDRFLFALFAALLLLAVPKIHKYHVVLPQAVFLFGLTRALAARHGPTACAVRLAVVSVVAGIFRVDFGAYAVACSCLALVLRFATEGWRRVVAAVFVLLGTGLAMVSPWLLFLASKASPIDLLARFFHTSTGVLDGMARSLPSYRWSSPPWQEENVLVLVFWFFRLLPAAVLVVWLAPRLEARRRRLPPPSMTAADRFLLIASLFAGLVFLQASHRVDLSHLKQVLPAALVILFLSLDRWLPRRRRRLPLRSIAAVVVLTAFLGSTLLHDRLRRPTTYDLSALGERLGSWSGTKTEVLARGTSRRARRLGAVVERIRELSGETDPVLFLPNLSQAYYFASRHFETPFGWFNPGRFVAAGAQERFIRRMSSTRWIVDEPDYSFDTLDDRNARVYAAAVMRHVYSSYRIREVVRDWVLLSAVEGEAPFAPPELALRTVETPMRMRSAAAPACAASSSRLLRVNTLPVAPGDQVSMPVAGGLLLDFEPCAGRSPRDAECSGAGLLQGERLWLVVDAGRRVPVAELRASRLIDTSALAPGRYTLVQSDCGDASGDDRLDILASAVTLQLQE